MKLLKILFFCYIVCAFVTAQQRIITAQAQPKSQTPYTVVVWSADWCSSCTQYKREEVPQLEELGHTVVIRETEGELPEFVSRVPTIVLYKNTERLKVKVYWRAKDIEKYIKDRL